jgi:hypothetical protein
MERGGAILIQLFMSWPRARRNFQSINRAELSSGPRVTAREESQLSFPLLSCQFFCFMSLLFQPFASSYSPFALSRVCAFRCAFLFYGV